MFKRAAIALLLLSACAPEAAPPKAPEAAEAEEAAPTQELLAEVEHYKPAPDGEISVTSPSAGARISSPLVAEGAAINNWFFEGVFLAELVVDGEVLAQAPAQQAGDKSWTDPGPVGFRAELAFQVSKETNAELILSEDMPAPISPDSDIAGPARSIRIPVVLLPAAQ